MYAKPLPSQEELNNLFKYDPGTGILIWKIRRTGKGTNAARLINYPAGHKWSADGRLKVDIGARSYFVHRIIWKMVHGTEPEEIDHIDWNPGNNRLENLRAATRSINRRNQVRCFFHGVST